MVCIALTPPTGVIAPSRSRRTPCSSRSELPGRVEAYLSTHNVFTRLSSMGPPPPLHVGVCVWSAAARYPYSRGMGEEGYDGHKQTGRHGQTDRSEVHGQPTNELDQTDVHPHSPQTQRHQTVTGASFSIWLDLPRSLCVICRRLAALRVLIVMCVCV